jgi:hypothetical protein
MLKIVLPNSPHHLHTSSTGSFANMASKTIEVHPKPMSLPRLHSSLPLQGDLPLYFLLPSRLPFLQALPPVAGSIRAWPTLCLHMCCCMVSGYKSAPSSVTCEPLRRRNGSQTISISSTWPNVFSAQIFGSKELTHQRPHWGTAVREVREKTILCRTLPLWIVSRTHDIIYFCIWLELGNSFSKKASCRTLADWTDTSSVARENEEGSGPASVPKDVLQKRVAAMCPPPCHVWDSLFSFLVCSLSLSVCSMVWLTLDSANLCSASLLVPFPNK